MGMEPPTTVVVDRPYAQKSENKQRDIPPGIRRSQNAWKGEGRLPRSLSCDTCRTTHFLALRVTVHTTVDRFMIQDSQRVVLDAYVRDEDIPFH